MCSFPEASCREREPALARASDDAGSSLTGAGVEEEKKSMNEAD